MNFIILDFLHQIKLAITFSIEYKNTTYRTILPDRKVRNLACPVD